MSLLLHQVPFVVAPSQRCRSITSDRAGQRQVSDLGEADQGVRVGREQEHPTQRQPFQAKSFQDLQDIAEIGVPSGHDLQGVDAVEQALLTNLQQPIGRGRSDPERLERRAGADDRFQPSRSLDHVEVEQPGDRVGAGDGGRPPHPQRAQPWCLDRETVQIQRPAGDIRSGVVDVERVEHGEDVGEDALHRTGELPVELLDQRETLLLEKRGRTVAAGGSYGRPPGMADPPGIDVDRTGEILGDAEEQGSMFLVEHLELLGPLRFVEREHAGEDRTPGVVPIGEPSRVVTQGVAIERVVLQTRPAGADRLLLLVFLGELLVALGHHRPDRLFVGFLGRLFVAVPLAAGSARRTDVPHAEVEGVAPELDLPELLQAAVVEFESRHQNPLSQAVGSCLSEKDTMAVLYSPLGSLARQLRAGVLCPTALLEAHIRRIERVDPALNAVAVRRYEAARREAARAGEELRSGADRGPLHGIPCTVKEFIAVEGLPHTGGIYARRERRAARDSTIVRRLRRAGAIVVATTNAPEGGLWHETNNRIYGRTANPHDLSRTSGGSSGGEAALIAAGGSPFGIGSDVGGSIRIPASFCGIYGHKPTCGLVPNTGHFPDAPAEPYMVCGPMARSAADLLPILRVIAGPDGEDPHARPWTLGQPEVEPARLRVFVVPDNGQASVRSEVRAAVIRAGASLAAAGAQIGRLELPELREAFQIWAGLMGAMGVRYEELVAPGRGIRLRREWLRWARARSTHAGAVLAMVTLQRALERFPQRVEQLRARALQLRSRLEQALGDDGVMLHPVFSRVAPRHRTIGIGNPADVGLTAIFNILGVPVTVAPVGRWGGLPIGVQIIAPRGADARTIAVASMLEQLAGGWTVAHPRRGPSRWRRG